MGNRMSSLPIAVFCSASAVLSEKHAAGRPAAMSSAFHAKTAGVEGWRKLWVRLTDLERETIEDWQVPADVTLPDGNVLKYEEATKEEEVMLDEHGAYTDNAEEAVSVGHPDLYWVVEHEAVPGDDEAEQPMRVLYLADMKKTDWSSVGGTRSLQLLAYAFALASKHECDGFVLGIWNITEAEWDWGQMQELDDLDDTATDLETVLAAATNTDGEYATGGHCHDCYGRRHCQEYLFPTIDPFSAMAPFSEPDGVTAENANELLDLYRQMSTAMDIAKEQLKAYTKVAGSIPLGSGKEWRETWTAAGNPVLNKKSLVAYFTSRPDQAEFLKQFMGKTKRRSRGCRVLNAKRG